MFTDCPDAPVQFIKRIFQVIVPYLYRLETLRPDKITPRCHRDRLDQFQGRFACPAGGNCSRNIALDQMPAVEPFSRLYRAHSACRELRCPDSFIAVCGLIFGLTNRYQIIYCICVQVVADIALMCEAWQLYNLAAYLGLHLCRMSPPRFIIVG